MDDLKNNSKTDKLRQETMEKLQQLNSNCSNVEKLTFENLVDKLNFSAKKDEKFVLMLISMLHKKCSSELLLALLYIIS